MNLVRWTLGLNLLNFKLGYDADLGWAENLRQLAEASPLAILLARVE